MSGVEYFPSGMGSSYLVTSTEMRAAEDAAIRAGTPASALMERAGAAVAAVIFQCYLPVKALVVCGGGNNGGDGRVIARLLRERGWEARDVGVAEFSEAMLEGVGLCVDALYGTGLNRAPEGAAARAVAAINAHGAPVVAVDIPSGVMADSGEAPGVAVKAAVTVTFGRAKPGLYLLPGKALAGRVVVADIGIAIPPGRVALNGPELWAERLPRLSAEDHKYTRGHAVVAGGPVAGTGASRLAARAALRAGAGLVSVVCSPASLMVYAGALESVMTKVAADGQAFAEIIAEKRVSAVLVGPGNGVGEKTRAFVEAAVASGKPCVLDADALHGPLPTLHEQVVLTPHEGEFSRLFSVSGEKIERARAAAAQAGCVVVLKGSDTVIASPQGDVIVNDSAPAWLATAGAGDVLAGMITGLLAQGMQAFDAAAAAAWWHGKLAGKLGRGMIAEDVVEAIRIYNNLLPW